jgi:hypothetical protein
MTILYCIFKNFFVIILKRSRLAFGTNHFLEAFNTLSQININDIITITIATGSDWLVVVAWAAAASAWVALAWLAAGAWAAATPYLNR